MAWPEGVGGKGNEGVAAYVQRIKGSIGYVEYAYAKKNKMTHAAVQNKDGQFVQPDDTTFQAAAAAPTGRARRASAQILTDQPGKTSWPITGASFILMHAKQDKPQNAAEVLKFFDWAFKNGQKMADELDYVAMPGRGHQADRRRLEVAGQGRSRQGALELTRALSTSAPHGPLTDSGPASLPAATPRRGRSSFEGRYHVQPSRPLPHSLFR